ncbi:MAG: proteasome accessory factor PafA2 family protein [Planctomycetota bacterium]|nr:proteasome accessory factor PafA2 family protein [Planctomycetota bacterium]
MKARAMGIETEYGVFKKPAENHIVDAFQDQWLPNGGRCYVDCGSHPEYATPECSNPLDVVRYDKAGEIILRNKLPDYLFFKHSVAPAKNGDGEVSFGCHENYQIATEHYDRIIKEIIPFLVTRQIFAGAGKVRNRRYHISQRSYHIRELVSPSATGKDKPIIKEHNEHLADKTKYRRLQIVSGDASMSELSTYLKIGTTTLVLDLLEQDSFKPIELKEPIAAIKNISQDPEYKWLVRTTTDKTVSAIDIQRNYLEVVKKQVSRDEITDDILARWEYVLNTLETDPMKLNRWIDWVIKKKLIDSYAGENRYKYGNQKIREIDLRYHDVNRDRGLFYTLQNQGLVERLIGDKDIKLAVNNPPQDTRAWLRGNILKSFPMDQIYRIDWDRGTVKIDDCTYKRFYLKEPLRNYQRKLNKLKKLC